MSDLYFQGETIRKAFRVADDGGQLSDYDDSPLPTATPIVDGSIDAANLVTPVNLTTGLYQISQVIPATWAAGSVIQYIVNYYLAGTSMTQLIDAGRLYTATATPNITVTSPYESATSTNLRLVQGDDYLNANATQIPFSNNTFTFTADSASVSVWDRRTGRVLVNAKAATLTSAAGPIQGYFELDAADTAAARPGDKLYQYGVDTLTSEGKKQRIAKGFITFDRDGNA